MTTPQTVPPARPYDGWRIAVAVHGSAFDQIRGTLQGIDRAASDLNLCQLRMKALLGAFPGAAVEVAADDGFGPTTVTISDLQATGDQAGQQADLTEEIGTRARQLLRAVYQRMDWFIEAQ